MIASPYSGSVNTWTIGSYVLQYRKVDTAGNTGTISRTVNVLSAPDTTAPILSLNGSGIVNIELGSWYIELGATWTDNVDGSGSVFGWVSGMPGSFTKSGSVNTWSLGSYTIIYKKVDSSGNSGSLTRTVNVVDTTPPVASIIYSSTGLTNGSVVATLTGASEPITITNNSGAATRTFNTNGSFTFIFTDISWNTGSSIATVNNIDTVPPVITLLGSANTTIYQWSIYTDAWATASDNTSWNITNAITVSGSVNTNIIWSYTVNYNVDDGVGNPALTVIRTVNVIAQAPIIVIGWGGGGGWSSSIGSDITSYISNVFDSAPNRVSLPNGVNNYEASSMTLWIQWLMRILREKIEKENGQKNVPVVENISQPVITNPPEQQVNILSPEVLSTNVRRMVDKWYIKNLFNLRLRDKITRAEFIKILSSIEWYSEQNMIIQFNDVPENSEFAIYINFAAMNNWINIQQAYFRPNDTISAWEATKILRSIIGREIPTVNSTSKPLNREEAIDLITEELSLDQ